ncbi:mannosyl-oligosaccharide-alpha-mannosidase [Diplodia corticola]|uniref:alpha-1,2-Mannosidase n=1 Tax=Diplodia corticola TaxID=236234 RepID=A0A1J9QNX2_9PEZI|nr:mannosyl-oligosaccharide-alpha-mannosidase [Diplodia corticola]OJD30144.1 mannosyl-oligosaccharide-alpha-mannosidase [Diplodia corticola]
MVFPRKHHPAASALRSSPRANGRSARTAKSSSFTFTNAIIACTLLLGLYLTHWLYSRPPLWSGGRTEHVYWEGRRAEVKEAFVTSWEAYSKYAWGYDRFHPVSKKGSQMSSKGLGWIIVDSLDTLMLMNLSSQLSDARLWVSRNLDYDQDQDVNTFETTIRMLGGLLSAHYLAKELRLPGASSRRDYIYLSKAVDLADRLLGAYDSPSGIPYASIDLRTGRGIRSHADGGASSTAEATTLQLEMKYLSNITGNDVYWRKAEHVMKVIDDNAAEAGLVPIFVDPHSGRFTTREIRLGSRGDSYYEYLIKQYLQTSHQEPIYAHLWAEALAGIQQHLVIPTAHARLTFVAELPHGIGAPLSPKMDHLVCFLPGAIALGATGAIAEQYAAARHELMPGGWTREDKDGQMALARELMKTCWAMHGVTATGLAPEIVWFDADEAVLSRREKGSVPGPLAESSDDRALWEKDCTVKPLDAHNLQRPETVESLFVMWRVTRDPVYREWGWEIFKAFREHTLVAGGEGYSSVGDVNAVPPPMRDNMESFWLAETLKYLYLLFSPDDFLPLEKVVFNTEAHVFPRMELGKFSTGWERRRGAK